MKRKVWCDCRGARDKMRRARKRTCERCGSELLKKNVARHRGTCGVELMRTRKTCQYCGKDLSEDYVKKNELACRKKQDERLVNRQIPMRLMGPRFKVQGSRLANDASPW